MGRDRAGEREMRRTHGRRVVAKHLSSRGGSVAFCFSHPRTSSFIRTPKCFPPCCFPSTFRFHGPHRVWIRFGNFLPLLMPTAGWKIRTAAAAAGQTITRTKLTDEANLFILERSKAASSIFISNISVRTLALGAPPLVHVRGCRAYPRTPPARNSRSPAVQRTSASTPRSGAARRAA